MVTNQLYDDKEWLSIAIELSLHSLDKSTKNGAIVVKNNNPLGYSLNKFVSNIPHTEVNDDKYVKLYYTIHSEEGAIFKAVKGHGYEAVKGSTLYCPFVCCAQCARTIVEFGISRVVGCAACVVKESGRWKESNEYGYEILRANNIQLDLVTDKLGKVMFYRGKELHL